MNVERKWPNWQIDGCAASGDLYRQILDSMTDGLYLVDLNRRITFWNRGAELITGYTAEEVMGRFCGDNLPVHTNAEGCQLCLKGCPLQATLADKSVRHSDLFLKHRDGHRVPVSVRVSPMVDSTGKVVGGVEVFSENSVKLAALEKAEGMEQLAFTDVLTAVGNRRFTERLLREAGDRYRGGGESFAILFFDIDNLKGINDSYGHGAGDAILKAVSHTIKNNLRSFDFLGRWGGDEFIVILAKPEERAKNVAERCCALVRSCAVKYVDRDIAPTVSIGVASIQGDESPAELVARADANLYQAKKSGRDQVFGA